MEEDGEHRGASGSERSCWACRDGELVHHAEVSGGLVHHLHQAQELLGVRRAAVVERALESAGRHLRLVPGGRLALPLVAVAHLVDVEADGAPLPQPLAAALAEEVGGARAARHRLPPACAHPPEVRRALRRREGDRHAVAPPRVHRH
eukprot:CAMPEP_0195610336 /NCGR_PEP_ID=MMETSP0815-20121206/9756_1 /TAXON_ID=97485 /ORGANISM="Prymnesium parvum, Strain Texoma1" /LENGTH=147 /DNA_ID=CAMNT_0040750321 /DNA_START=190 /DNA_END=630 /DNA_ORIENTATION=+